MFASLTPGRRSSTALEAAQVSCFHHAMAQRRECDQHRTRKPRERRVRALDEDAAMAGGWLRASKIQPVRGGPSSYDQPRSAISERLQIVFPCDRGAPMAVGNRQNEIPRWIDSRDDEGVLGARNRRHDVTADRRLEFGYDAPRTGRAAIVNQIPAVPAGTTAAHLRNPWPDLFWRRIDRNGVGGREDWVGHHHVDRKRTMPFDSRRKAGSERHNTMDAAFAVPATHRGRRA